MPCNQLLVALRFYATGSFHITNGDFFKICPSTTSKIIKNVSRALASLGAAHIQLPVGEEVEVVKREFHEIAGFPNLIGAIDCTHVKIQSVGKCQTSDLCWFCLQCSVQYQLSIVLTICFLPKVGQKLKRSEIGRATSLLMCRPFRTLK